MPPWYPLDQDQIVIFDEDSNSAVQTDGGPKPFRFAAGRVTIANPTASPLSDTLTVPPGFPFGWLHLDLNTATPGGVLNPVSQSFVAALFSADALPDRVAAAVETYVFDSACSPLLTTLDPTSLPSSKE